MGILGVREYWIKCTGGTGALGRIKGTTGTGGNRGTEDTGSISGYWVCWVPERNRVPEALGVSRMLGVPGIQGVPGLLGTGRDTTFTPYPVRLQHFWKRKTSTGVSLLIFQNLSEKICQEKHWLWFVCYIHFMLKLSTI